VREAGRQVAAGIDAAVAIPQADKDQNGYLNGGQLIR
jgi:hypothetical protein